MLKGQRCSNQFPPLSSDMASVVSASTDAVTANSEPLVTGAEVALTGAANLDVYDAQDKHTGIVPGTLYQTEVAIPGSNYVWVDGGRTATLMTDSTYTVVVHGIQADGAAMIRVNTLTAGIATKSVIFENIVVTGTGVATFTLNLPGPTVSRRLDVQYSSASPLQEVNQLPELTGEAATDLLPPHTTLTIDAQGTVNLDAVDSGGAGVRYIQYSSENPPLHFSQYSGPFQLEPNGHVTAFATDWAGNSEYPPARVGQFSLLYIPTIRGN
jgi:hypothetical protein